jgi:hypothetical protein
MPTPNTLEQSTARVLALRDAGLRDPLVIRVFAALHRVANALIVPANGYSEDVRAVAKRMNENHGTHVTWAESIAASIATEESGPFWEALPDEQLEALVLVFVRRYFGLPDVPEVFA